jgi:hypothetical protein
VQDAVSQKSYMTERENTVHVATKAGAWVSPYTPQNLDTAISHLERVLRAEGVESLFAQTYWRGRVLQAYATPGLLQRQRERLQRLLDRLASAPADSRRRMHSVRERSPHKSGHPMGTGLERLTCVTPADGAAASLRVAQNHRSTHALQTE